MKEKQINKFESLPVIIKKKKRLLTDFALNCDQIQCHNPIFYRFVEKTVFPNVIVRNKASKVLFTIIGIGVLQM